MKRSKVIWLSAMLVAVAASAASAADYADVMCSYERGINANPGFTNPDLALQPGGWVVSLGQWTDNPNFGNNSDPVGIILGFSTSIRNGPGNDLNVMGNAFLTWYEPGYVEVARETSGSGATVNGWQDETWYLIKPSNYDQLDHDPRNGPLTINYTWDEPTQTGTYGDPWSSQEMTGYADVTPGGDLMDIDWAIDPAGDPVSLADIAYVHIRTVTDSSADIYGYFTTEIDYVEAMNGYVPEPAMLVLLALGLPAVVRRRRK